MPDPESRTGWPRRPAAGLVSRWRGTRFGDSDRALTEFRTDQYFADKDYQKHLIDAVEQVGQLSQATASTRWAAGPLHSGPAAAAVPVEGAGPCSPYLLGALS